MTTEEDARRLYESWARDWLTVAGAAPPKWEDQSRWVQQLYIDKADQNEKDKAETEG